MPIESFSPWVYCWGCQEEIPKEKIQRCAGCYLAIFHDNVCQEGSWPQHKVECTPTRTLYKERKATGYDIVKKYFPTTNKNLPAIEIKSKEGQPIFASDKQRIYSARAMEAILKANPAFGEPCLILMRTLGQHDEEEQCLDILAQLYMREKNAEAKAFLEKYRESYRHLDEKVKKHVVTRCLMEGKFDIAETYLFKHFYPKDGDRAQARRAMMDIYMNVEELRANCQVLQYHLSQIRPQMGLSSVYRTTTGAEQRVYGSHIEIKY